jgi:2-polyprenyl-3-methyl-5-hydroxy-6-metoxy-1,4-benzoquinol methylase
MRFKLPRLRPDYDKLHDQNDEKEFDFQWRKLPSPYIEYTEKRVEEFLDLTRMPRGYFENKLCLDAGCGNGRWTYAMMRLGAKVVSFDVSSAAVEACRRVNLGSHQKGEITLTREIMINMRGVYNPTPRNE